MKNRNIPIDFFKGILVVMMILAHSLQFFVNLNASVVASKISDYVNLTTFSGFVFAFGYVSYHAYLKKDFLAASKRLFINMLKLLFAFYISSFAFVVLIRNPFFSTDIVLDVLLVRWLAGYSEFLFSFVCLMVLCTVLFPLLKRLNSTGALIIIAVSLIATFIPYRDVNPILGSFIGGTNFAYFSVVQYFGFFVIGIMFASKEIVFDKKALIIGLAATSVFLVYTHVFGLPSRFPVSAIWIIGPAGFLYIYYLLANYMPISAKTEVLANIGSKSLYYLVFSNILIFALYSSRFYEMGVPTALMVFCITVAICFFLASIVKGRG